MTVDGSNAGLVEAHGKPGTPWFGSIGVAGGIDDSPFPPVIEDALFAAGKSLEEPFGLFSDDLQ